MLLTLFSDASHCPETFAAGWGAWAKGDGWPSGKVFGGPITTKPTNSGQAELMGIVSAIHYVQTENLLGDAKAIVLQCDSTDAIGMLLTLKNARFTKGKGDRDVANVSRRQTTIPKPMRDALKYAAEMTKGLELWVRHVKGHNSGSGRSWVNRECDKIAKQYMEQMRCSLKTASLQSDSRLPS